MKDVSKAGRGFHLPFCVPLHKPAKESRPSDASSSSSDESMPPLRRRSSGAPESSASARRRHGVPPPPPERVTLADITGIPLPSADEPAPRARRAPGSSIRPSASPSTSAPPVGTQFPPMKPLPPMEPFPPMPPLTPMGPLPPMQPLPPMDPLPPMQPFPPMPPLRPTPEGTANPNLTRTDSAEFFSARSSLSGSPTLSRTDSGEYFDAVDHLEPEPGSTPLDGQGQPIKSGSASGAQQPPPPPPLQTETTAPPPPPSAPTSPQRAGRKKLPKPPKPAPEPSLDKVQHKLHRTTAERVAGPALGWIAKRSQGWGSVLGGVVNEAPAGAQGKPVLVKPDDHADVEGRVQEIGRRTQQLVAHLDQQPEAVHAPVGRKKKKGLMSKVKGAVLGATSLTTLAAKLQPGKPAPAATALAAAAGLPGETLRAQVARHAAAVADAQAALTQATADRKNASYMDRPARAKVEKQCRQALEEAVAMHQASVTMLEAGEAAERVAQNTATLAKVTYAAGELERYQSELGKLVVPGALPGPAERWAGRLNTLFEPLANMTGQLALQVAPQPGDDGVEFEVEHDNPALDPIAKATGKALQQLQQLAAGAGPSNDSEAQAAVLKVAEEVLGQTEAVYLALSKAVKTEQRALLIANAHVERLQNTLNAEHVEDEPALRAALDTAVALRDGTQATVGMLREARTAMKKDVAQIRQTYHEIAHEATTAAAEAPDAPPAATAAATVAGTVASAAASHAEQFTDAKTRMSGEKKLQRATERERMDAAVENLSGFAPTTDAAGAAALRAQLRVAQAGLDPKRQGSELAASTVLKSLTSALSQVTGGDPARAARAAQALNTHSMLHWMDDTPTDDPTVNDVRQLHRLMSAMPRGMEVLARLSLEPASLDKRENVAASRGNLSDLRTYWVADKALAEADPADADTQAWLGAAKSMASRQLHKALGTARAEGASSSAAAEEPTPLEQAAINGVRNGYLTRAPGSPYDKARTMLDKLSTQWTVAPDRHRVPLDENLSSNQIRAAAGALGDFVESRPPGERRTEDSLVRAFAAFSAGHPELHARSKLSAAHLAELTAMTLPPQAQLQGAQADSAEDAAAAVVAAVCVLPDEVLNKGMAFSDALAAVARLAKKSHPEAAAQAALAQAMDDYKPGSGERKTGFGTKLANSVGTAVSSALAPTTNPLNDFGMQRLNAMSSGLGMNTRAKMAGDQLQAALGALEQAAGAADQGGIAMLCDGLRRIDGDAVNSRLSREYAKALQQRLNGAGHDLVVRTDLTLQEYATHLLQQLRAAGSGDAPTLDDDLAGDIQAALTSAHRLSLHPDLPSVKTLDDLVDVVTQFVSEDELRDKRKILNGHEFGIGLPLNPFALSGVPLGATVKYSRKKEEMLEVGMYINLAEVTTHKGEFGVSAGMNADAQAGDGAEFTVGLGGGITGAIERQEATTLSLRLPRQRGTEAKLREQVPQIMKDLAEFAAQPDDEHEHPDALSLLLAKHQDLAVVVTDDQGAWTKTADARANFLNFGQRISADRGAGIGGTALGISASLEYASEWKKESVGGFTTNDFTSSVKANIAADTGFRMPVKVDGHEKDLNEDWRLRPPGTGTALLGGFRNFVQRLDKMQISEATAEGATIDADTDEFAFSPETLLQDLQDNREAWLERGLNVLMKRKPADVEPHQRDTVGRRLAEAELVQFEEAIKDMAKNEKFTQYNVNYSLSDAAKGRLGDIRLEEELARAAGDTATANRLAGEHVALLQSPDSWEPNKVMARVKAKVPVNLGVDMVVKAKTTFQVEGQRVPWQYPA